MTLQQLKYVAAVADTRNITEAAKRVFISQPSLTAAIHELENEINIVIFNRSNKGVTITNEGDEFLSYARQVLEQAALLEERYKGNAGGNTIFSISCQHYSFAVNAFVDVIRKFGGDSYDFTLRETQTNEIIDDVAKMKSEIGVLYLCGKNEKVVRNLLKKNNLVFEPLFTTPLHVFMSAKNPLALKECISLSDLAPYPYLRTGRLQLVLFRRRTVDCCRFRLSAEYKGSRPRNTFQSAYRPQWLYNLFGCHQPETER